MRDALERHFGTLGAALNVFHFDDTPCTTGHWSQGYTLFAFEDGRELIISSFPDWRTADAVGFADRPCHMADELDEAVAHHDPAPPPLWNNGRKEAAGGRSYEPHEVPYRCMRGKPLAEHHIIFTRPEFWIDNKASLTEPCPDFPFTLERAWKFWIHGRCQFLVLELQYDESRAVIPESRCKRIRYTSKAPFEAPRWVYFRISMRMARLVEKREKIILHTRGDYSK